MGGRDALLTENKKSDVRIQTVERYEKAKDLRIGKETWEKNLG